MSMVYQYYGLLLLSFFCLALMCSVSWDVLGDFERFDRLLVDPMTFLCVLKLVWWEIMKKELVYRVAQVALRTFETILNYTLNIQVCLKSSGSHICQHLSTINVN